MKRKQVMAFVLAAAMALSMLAGCGQKGQDADLSQSAGVETESGTVEQDSAEALAAEPEEGEIGQDAFFGETITIATYKHADDFSEGSDGFNQKPAVIKAEDATGIHVEWEIISADAVGEKTKVMLSSGELPDVMWQVLNQETVYNNASLFYDFSQDDYALLKKYAPAVWNDMATYENGGIEAFSYADGGLYALPTGFISANMKNKADVLCWINKAWLDQLQMDVPTTLEEFTEVLRAFKENDMNGNGDPDDEIPFLFADVNDQLAMYNMEAWFGLNAHSAAFAQTCRTMENGTVKSTVDTQAYRAFLDFAHLMMEEGLADAEGMSQTVDQFNAKLDSDLAGCLFAWTPKNHMQNAELSEEFVPLAPIQCVDGVEPRQNGLWDAFKADRGGFAVSASCEHIEAVLHWWNYMASSTDIKMDVDYGPDKWAYMEDGRPTTFRAPDDVIPEGMNEAQYCYTTSFMSSRAPVVREDEVPGFEPGTDVRADIIEAWEPYIDKVANGDDVLSYAVSAEIDDERNMIQTELITYIKNFQATSIMDGYTDEDWEAHLKSLKDYQYYEWLEWYQKYADGEFKE